MCKRFIVLCSVLFFSCSKDDTLISKIDEVNSIPEKEIFLTERYSKVNETTGYFKGQEYITSYLSKDFIKNELSLPTDGHSDWNTFHKNIAISDFNGDGLPDIIAFATSSCDSHTYSFHKGKFIFIDDYLGSKLKEVLNADHYFGTGDMVVNDYNRDGINEVLFFSTETKMNSFIEEENVGGDTNNPPLPPAIISYNNGLRVQYVGFAGDSHTGTSGDIDNDGDIDFIQWPIPSTYNFRPVEYPPSLLSNTEDLYFSSSNLITDLDYKWYATAIDLFDVNGDGNLDLIVGWRIGQTKWFESSPTFSNSLSSPILMFGDGSGKFSLANSVRLLETSISSKNISATILGYGFTDFDQDGDIDILVTTTRDEPGGSKEDGTYYDNFYLVMYENQNNTFVDITLTSILGSFNQTGEFPNFYKIRTLDIDMDGDIDFIPDAIANWGSINYSSSLVWLNKEKKFTLFY